MGCLDVLSLPPSPDRDMAGRHQARPSSIQIRQVAVIPAKKCRRAHVKQMQVLGRGLPGVDWGEVLRIIQALVEQ